MKARRRKCLVGAPQGGGQEGRRRALADTRGEPDVSRCSWIRLFAVGYGAAMVSDLDTSPPKSSFPPSGGVAVVVNGNAKNVTDEVISNLDQILRGTDLYVSKSLEHAKQIAEQLVLKGYGTVLTGGGDGTFTVMVSEIVAAAERLGRPRPRFGFLKLGTGNALAHVVGVSGKDGLAADIRRLKEEAGSRKIGLVEVDGTLTPFCGFGADAEMLEDYARVKNRLAATPLKRLGQGLAGYVLSGLGKTLPRQLLRPMFHCRIVNCGGPVHRLGPRGAPEGRPMEYGEVIYEGPARMIAASTIPYLGFGLRFFPFAEEYPEQLSLRIATMGATEFARNIQAIWKGEYANPRHLIDFVGQDVLVTVDPAQPFQVGGDLQCQRHEARLRLSPKPIRLVDFYVPPRAS